MDGEHVEGFETSPGFACRLKKPSGLVSRQRVHLLRRGRGRLDRVCRVAGDEVPPYGLGERLVHDVVHLLDRGAGEPGVETISAEPLEVGAFKFLSLIRPMEGLR